MKIGIVGGMGPESTVDYYKTLIYKYKNLKKDGSYPKIIIDSIDMKEVLHFISTKQWYKLVDMLVSSLNNLYIAGANIAVISSNTPHIVFQKVKKLAPMPVLSIVEETRERAKELRLKRLGLLGTIITMEESFYKDSFLKSAIDIVIPRKAEREYINQRIVTELQNGIINKRTKEGFLNIIRRMIKEESIDGVILGCTEIPIILKNGELNIPFLNTVDIHVDGIIKELRKNDEF
ncbi:aspartate racemase [Clostridium pasteurianum DSM 525 = ATCC 6013]|uniref:Aspartate racemase n=1 Tax=Clostridium pasteurianum DSM 525 = ATCC 6013 TaxID=1262449 RepID=A0A0H3JA36_CLOPA|nr:amino acid racemase [Clostridium pasteurianum]AJA49208.1 aspartate racemase [Clostridium pasteurianum DSM 525 = ATCC 6013]AJA53196.1 aspartate racemase [Clostridium pasteurianum DSM 525 = ATCC 6013]AOZ76390.1 aspartate racemase [Clostridium pasteurianum DSM 525 = ATCC 6013]AOZ80187.1 aspartate racemase [Clostridium pasteurianum]ELP59141.1 aspartate racemase [Clostridium pasteurianum DSM 525 = ATCC 6013]